MVGDRRGHVRARAVACRCVVPIMYGAGRVSVRALGPTYPPLV